MRGPGLCKLPPPPHGQSWRFASRRHRAPGRHHATGMQGRWEPGAQQTLPSPDHNSSPAELQQGAERMQRGWNRKKAPFLSPFAHFTYRAAPAVLKEKLFVPKYWRQWLPERPFSSLVLGNAYPNPVSQTHPNPISQRWQRH